MSNKREIPYFLYSLYLKEKYGRKIFRLAVDAGFSCPNRGPDRRKPGCLYCGESGSRAPYLEKSQASLESNPDSLKKQIETAKAFLEARYKAKDFILYFQAFSNTNASVQVLKEIYDTGLSCAEFLELIVSTRPDCIDEAKADLLASYKTENREVWVELGLQSAQDQTLIRIQRGHTLADFIKAYWILKRRGLKLGVHLIFGLPGENEEKILSTIKTVAALNPDGIKIHNLHIVKGTELETLWQKGEVRLLSWQEHLELVIKALQLLPASTVIMRLICDTPQAQLIAPLDFLPKQQFLDLVMKTMLKRGVYQGQKYC